MTSVLYRNTRLPFQAYIAVYFKVYHAISVSFQIPLSNPPETQSLLNIFKEIKTCICSKLF